MDRLRIGLLGSGDITRRVSNGFKNIPEIEMYAVASRNVEHAKAFAQEYGYQRVYETYEELMNDPDVDMLYIGLPHPQHYEYVKKALVYKKPALCEKPFTLNHHQAKDIIDAYEKENVFLQEALWTRFLPVKKQSAKM